MEGNTVESPTPVQIIQSAKETEEKFAVSAEILKLDLELAYCGNVNLREVTISELQDALSNGRITVEALTQSYLKRIEAINPFLNAVTEVNPDALTIAKELDKERRNSKQMLGPLHGIPVLIKENIGTNDKMETTAGSLALIGLKPKEDAQVVKRLREAGAVIIGKANLSEFANFRGKGIPSGWSGRGKQTKNAYVLSKDPSGSSSGSVVGVTANLCVVSLGTETDGSIISPSSAGSAVGLKPTVGHVSSVGVIPLSCSQDSVGPIARTVKDAALLLNVISEKSFSSNHFTLKNPEAIDWLNVNLTVGVLRYPLWTFADDSQLPELEKALDALRISGINVIDPVEIEEEILQSVSAENERAVFHCEFKTGINEYLATAVCPVTDHSRDCNKIRCLSDIIEFNKNHPVKEKYAQEELELADATDGILDPSYIEKRNTNIKAAKNLVDTLLEKYSLDAVVGPTDSRISFFAAVSGYPIISIPAGFGSDGIPFGIAFFGTANSEEKLLLIAARLESAFKSRRTPLFLK